MIPGSYTLTFIVFKNMFLNVLLGCVRLSLKELLPLMLLCVLS